MADTERIYHETYIGVGEAVPMCPDCGALVASTERHDEWHRKQERHGHATLQRIN